MKSSRNKKKAPVRTGVQWTRSVENAMPMVSVPSSLSVPPWQRIRLRAGQVPPRVPKDVLVSCTVVQGVGKMWA